MGWDEEHIGNFQDDGEVLYLACGSGHTGAYFPKAKQIEALDGYVLQYVNHTSVNLTF